MRRTSRTLVAALFFLFTIVLTVHTFDHVRRVDEMMAQFVEDLRRNVSPDTPHTTIGYDWPTETDMSNALSASVNPLFGAHYYMLLERGGIAAIHETSVLRLRPEYSWIRPPFRGGTRAQFHASVVHQMDWCERFQSVAVTGKNREAADAVEKLRSMGFTPVCAGAFWTILLKDNNLEAP